MKKQIIWAEVRPDEAGILLGMLAIEGKIE
jgi:hypothetical protein